MNEIGKRIAEARRAKGMTQAQLAEEIHVTRAGISHWETGRTVPDYDTLRRLSEILGVSFSIEAEGKQPEPAQPDELPAEAEPLAETQEMPLRRGKVSWRIAGTLGAILLAVVLCAVYWPRSSETKQQAKATAKPFQFRTAAPAVLPAGRTAAPVPTRIPDEMRKYSQAWFYKEDEPVEGEAFVNIVFDSDPIYAAMDEDDEGRTQKVWFYRFSMYERNGVDFHVDRLEIRMFDGKTPVDMFPYEIEDIAEHIGGDTVTKGQFLRFRGGDPVQSFTHVAVVLKGTDANGVEKEFHSIAKLDASLQPVE